MDWIFITCVGTALLLALMIGHFADPIGRRLDLLDFPDIDGGRKRHERITPMVGGTAIVSATLFALATVLLCAPEIGVSLRHSFWALAATVLVLYAIGLTDDRFGLSPVIRLIAAMIMLMLVISYAPDFSLNFMRFSGQDEVWLLGGWISDAFVLLCLVGLLNAVNMADGKDGIVISLALVWTIVLAFRLPATMAPVLASTGAALAVMLWYNMRAKLFLGDSGSYAISTLFGLLAIYAYNHDFAVMRADDVAVLFCIPVYDTLRLMVTRKLGKRSMFQADRDHLHHHLHRSFGWPRGLVIYVAMVAVPNAGALLWQNSGLFWLITSALIYAIILWQTRFPEPELALRA